MPLAQRCQCLGDFKSKNYSIEALDMFCRNDTWDVMPSIHRDENQKQLDVVVPSKVRCGSTDPLEMNVTNQCSCWPTAGEGASKNISHFITKSTFLFLWWYFAVGGKVLYAEILNIPWTNDLLDLASETFKNAKYVVEEAVSSFHILLLRKRFLILLLLVRFGLYWQRQNISWRLCSQYCHEIY